MDISHFLEFVYEGKKRKTGEKATSHFYEVQKLLKNVGVTDKEILDAALLHDILEDTNLNKNYLALKFGERVMQIVYILSKEAIWNTSYCKMKSNIDAMENTWADYPEAVLIKMADRLHNLQTIDGFRIPKQHEYIEETYEILIPMFDNAIKKGHVGYLKPMMQKILKDLKQEAAKIQKKLETLSLSLTT